MTSPTPSFNRLKLFEMLDAGRSRMREVVSQVQRDQSIYPPWTIKEVLAHIAGWDDAATASLLAHAHGIAPATPAIRGVDYYNAQTVAERSALDFDHVQREWESSRDALKKAILETSDERLQQPLVLPWGGTGTVEQLVQTFAEHEREHATEILSLIHPSPEEKAP